MNSKVKKIIAVALIVLGVLVVASPHIAKMFMSHRSHSINMEKVSDKQIKNNRKNAKKDAKYNGDNIKDINLNGAITNKEKADMSKLIGQLVIPSVKMNIALFEGLDNSNLLYGACTMKPDQRMGSGNYAIAGHYMDKKDVLFGGLVDVKKGDIMRVTDKSTIYEYKVVALEKVPDSKLEMISNKRAEKYGKPIMSLMTCYYNETSYRYFVIGELERSYKYRTDDMIRGL